MLNDLGFCRTIFYLGINLSPFFIFGIYEIPPRVKRNMWQTMGILIMEKEILHLGFIRYKTMLAFLLRYLVKFLCEFSYQ